MTYVGPEDSQLLYRLIAQYSEDYSYFFSTEREAYDEYATGSEPSQIAGALIALDGLLNSAPTEVELERRLERMDFSYDPTVGDSPTYRDFLLRLRGWLVESLKERPPGPVPGAEQ